MSDQIRQALSRRRFLYTLGVGAALPLVGCDSSRPQSGFLGAMERVNGGVQGALFRSGSGGYREPDSELTPTDVFPAYKIGKAFPVAPAAWTLRVGGMVARPQSFSLADLQRMTRADLRLRHHCVEGWSALADWHGVRVRDLAELVGADPRATVVDFRSFEADPDKPDAFYWSSWDRASALHAQTLVAYGQNGADLDLRHGAPLRLYSSVKLGYKNVKWLASIDFLDERTGGYWENLGYEWFAGT